MSIPSSVVEHLKIMLFALPILATILIICFLLFRTKELEKRISMLVEEVNEVTRSFLKIVDEMKKAGIEIKDSSEILTGIGRGIGTNTMEQRLVAKARASTTITFNVRNVFTPRIILTTVKPVVIHESRLFRKTFKKLICVETDAPSLLAFTLDGDLDKFMALRVVVRNKKAKIELSKDSREGVVKLDKIGKSCFHVLVEGIPRRVDSDLQVVVSIGVELKVTE